MGIVGSTVGSGSSNAAGTPIPYVVNVTQAAYANTGAATITVPVPAGLEGGDLVIIAGTTRNSFLADPSTSGWTQLYEVGVKASGAAPDDPLAATNDVGVLWWKVATDGEPATYDCVVTDDGTDGQVLTCMVVRNASSIQSVYSIDGAKVAPSLNATAGDALVSVHGLAFGINGTLPNAPDGMYTIAAQHEATSDVGQAIGFEYIHTTEATGTRTWQSSWAGTDTVYTSMFRIS